MTVELLSGNKKHDLQPKKQLYETFGVKAYFIVNPADKEGAPYYFDGKKFVLQEARKGKVKSKLLRKTVVF
ncbi:Uma2 family endonuclease [Niabella aurantiaca]|uniref:Uma2 family endonuclease n=1 Tax=Niabella aurantiaca TaxID=379900 RepID=UPI000368C570|nr:Uma2 family endonuclease [Niabella aurantiaca]